MTNRFSSVRTIRSGFCNAIFESLVTMIECKSGYIVFAFYLPYLSGKGSDNQKRLDLRQGLDMLEGVMASTGGLAGTEQVR